MKIKFQLLQNDITMCIGNTFVVLIIENCKFPVNIPSIRKSKALPPVSYRQRWFC